MSNFKKDNNCFEGDWSRMGLNLIASCLGTDTEKGLSKKRAKELQKRYGKNILEKAEGLDLINKFFLQFKNPLVLILLVAGILTVFLGEYVDSIVIFLALIVNVVIGLFQEERASRAFNKLADSQEKMSSVLRDGKRVIIKVEDLVLGDIVILESGMGVPADIRIIECVDLLVDESMLTGEWVSVKKDKEIIEEEKPSTEKNNMLWMGTLISSGQGIGVVVGIGNNTELGEISKHLVGRDKTVTPIQRSINKLSVFISYVALLSVVFIFIVGVIKGESMIEMFLIAIAVAVSVVPEGLPAAITVVLAVGMEKILNLGGLVKNLVAAETLGSTTVILTDKTGTLTQAKMRIEDLITFDNLEAKFSNGSLTSKSGEGLLKMAVLSSDAFMEEIDSVEDKKTEIVIHGRPIEKAIIMEGLSRGISQSELNKKDEERIDFFAFNSENRFAVSLNKLPDNNENVMYLSGSPEFLLNLSSFVDLNGEKQILTEEIKEKFIKKQNQKSEEGMRFLGIAYQSTKATNIPRNSDIVDRDKLKEVVFKGLISFNDPIREDVKGSIKEAKNAGAKIIMITGDNPQTALKIAKMAGLANEKTNPILGSELNDISNQNLLELLRKNTVFARVLPSQKLRIVNILKNAGEVVAMTGDGINDAPALRNANIGIAVGSGTEVAKESSDLILLNNSFSIIVGAIKEGRRIVDNIKKIVSHLMSTSFGEIFLIGGALLLSMPLPILPAQILWVNIIEGGLLNFAFSFEPAEEGIMKKKPKRGEEKNILSLEIKKFIIYVGVVTGVFTLILYWVLMSFGISIEEARTIMFVTLTLDSMFFMFSFKNFKKPLWKINIFSNKFLLVSFSASLLILFVALKATPLRNLLQLTVLNGMDFIIVLVVAIFNLATVEIVKYFLFERKGNK